MDKRILRTKKNLKEALIRLLGEKKFDSISTTEICEAALVSRNTFYNYYDDKYALLEECFSDYEKELLDHFSIKQEEENPKHEIRLSFLNLLDAFFDTEEQYQSVPILSSFDLASMYYRAVMHIVEQYEDRYAGYISQEYDLKQLNSFLILGFWGFTHADSKLSREEKRERARKLMTDLLNSPIFRNV